MKPHCIKSPTTPLFPLIFTHTLSKKTVLTPSRQSVSHLVPYLMVMDSQHGKNCRRSGLHIALRNDEEYEESEVWEVLDDNGGSTDLSPAFYHEDEPRAPIRKNRASVVGGIPRPRPSSGALRVLKSAPDNISYWGKDSMGSSSSGKKKEVEDEEGAGKEPRFVLLGVGRGREEAQGQGPQQGQACRPHQNRVP